MIQSNHTKADQKHFYGISENIDDVKKCIQMQDINGLNKDGESSLHLAVKKGSFGLFSK